MLEKKSAKTKFFQQFKFSLFAYGVQWIAYFKM